MLTRATLLPLSPPPPTAATRPSGDTASASRSPRWRWNSREPAGRSTSHTRTLPSIAPATTRPAGVNATRPTCAVWPLSTAVCFPCRQSQSCTPPPPDIPTATVRPSGETARSAGMACSCAPTARNPTGPPAARSQTHRPTSPGGPPGAVKITIRPSSAAVRPNTRAGPPGRMTSTAGSRRVYHIRTSPPALDVSRCWPSGVKASTPIIRVVRTRETSLPDSISRTTAE